MIGRIWRTRRAAREAPGGWLPMAAIGGRYRGGHERTARRLLSGDIPASILGTLVVCPAERMLFRQYWALWPGWPQVPPPAVPGA